MSDNPNPIAAAAEEIAKEIRARYGVHDFVECDYLTVEQFAAALLPILTRHFAPATTTDEGAITEEFLRVLGFTWDECWEMFSVGFIDAQEEVATIEFDLDDRIAWIDVRPVKITTRSQLLQLLTALGIVPRE